MFLQLAYVCINSCWYKDVQNLTQINLLSILEWIYFEFLNLNFNQYSNLSWNCFYFYSGFCLFPGMCGDPGCHQRAYREHGGLGAHPPSLVVWPWGRRRRESDGPHYVHAFVSHQFLGQRSPRSAPPLPPPPGQDHWHPASNWPLPLSYPPPPPPPPLSCHPRAIDCSFWSRLSQPFLPATEEPAIHLWIPLVQTPQAISQM